MSSEPISPPSPHTTITITTSPTNTTITTPTPAPPIIVTPTPPIMTSPAAAPAAAVPFDPTATHIAYLHAWPLIGKLGTGDPFPIKKLDFDSERSLLFSTLNQANKSIRLQMEVATSDNLLRLITMGCRAIHYTGHGMPACLAFEDDEGKMHPMDPAQLKELVEAGRSSGSGPRTGIEFVFVSACHSESAGLAFVAAGVPHVIAVKTEAAVCDRASQVFMNHFYLALLVGKTVRQSFDIGQKAVRHNPRLNGGDEPRKFLLLPEAADHERTLFTDIPPGRWTDASAPPVPHTIPAIPENFLGRNFLIQKVIACLAKKRLVTLTGARGIGKTSVAIAAARYIWKRSHFDGVFMVDVRKLLPSHDQKGERGESDANNSSETHHDTNSSTNSSRPTLSTLVSQACQLEETHRSPARLFRALQSYPKLLLILDGADCVLRAPNMSDESGEGEGEGSSNSSHSSSSSHHPNHDIRGFISDLLRAVPGSKVLVTSCFALAGIQDVVEAQLEVRPLAPIDAAQLFYDLRPREIELAEFGCDDPKKAASRLSEHPALKLLAGHPRRIFNAVPNLRDVKMIDLTPIIEAQIKKELRMEQQQQQADQQAWNQSHTLQQPHGSHSHMSPTPKTLSRTHTPEPIQVGNNSSSILSPFSHASHSAFAPVASPAANDLFDHNLYLWFGGHGSARSSALQANGHPPLSDEEQSAWTESTQSGVNFWKNSFGRSEVVPWNESLDRILNIFFMTYIGSNERPLESLDLRTFQTKLESLGSPQGFMHVQIFGSFWRDWIAFCSTIKSVLPYWTCQQPTRIIHGWCNRQTCTNLLIESINPNTGVVVNRPIGTFILRMSESQVGSIAVGFVDQTNKILHTLITMKGDHFLLNLTDGGRSYPSLSDLLLQCRPFVSLYPGIDKLSILSPQIVSNAVDPNSGSGGVMQGEGVPSVQPSHGQSGGSLQFQSFPNNASGGAVGLFSPPPPGSHGQSNFTFPAVASQPMSANPMERPPLVHAQSTFTPSHSHPVSSGVHHLPHPSSFPSLSSVGIALPPMTVSGGSNPHGEGVVPQGEPSSSASNLPEGWQQAPPSFPSPPGGFN